MQNRSSPDFMAQHIANFKRQVAMQIFIRCHLMCKGKCDACDLKTQFATRVDSIARIDATNFLVFIEKQCIR